MTKKPSKYWPLFFILVVGLMFFLPRDMLLIYIAIVFLGGFGIYFLEKSTDQGGSLPG